MYKVYIGCLPASCTMDMLKSYFSQFDNVKEVRLSKRPGNKLCSGNGSFSCTDKSAFDFIVAQREFNFYGRTIYCNPLLNGEELQQKNQELSKRRIFLSSLPPEVSDEMLETIMATFGKVENAYRIKSLKNESKPFGFVTYFSPSSAEEAVKAGQIVYLSHLILISEYKKSCRFNQSSKKALEQKDKSLLKALRNTSPIRCKSSPKASATQFNSKETIKVRKALENQENANAKPTTRSYHLLRRNIADTSSQLRFNIRAGVRS